MSSKRSSGKKIDYLNKRIPENPKYKHIKHAIDTGASITSYLEKVEEIKKNYKYRRDEIFKRLKSTTFAQLILQVAESELEQDTSLTSQGSTSSGQELITPHEDEKENEEPPSTARSTVSSLVCGIGELDVGSSQPPPVQYQHHSTNLPYLLLDVRDRECYDQCHIIGAQSYPAVMLTRSCNYFTREILEYKNKPGKIIILYDEDERIVPQAATTFVQREVDNVFMLSGGLKILYKVFPEGMLTGQIPKTCYPSPPPSARKSVKTPTVRFPPPTAMLPSAPHKEYFTPDDLDSIQAKLDDALLSNDGGLSSRATSRSSSTVASSRATTQSSSRPTSKPWK